MPDSITFDSARSEIKPQFYAVLDSLASTLVQYNKTTIQVAGHTDSRGSDQYNHTLSIQRANSVKNHLAQQRVAGNRMLAVGHGESRPVADNNSDYGRAQNRRVEITLVPMQQG
jgi:outer membrane protein OmpA-like peptidoglycan-associated protein